MKTVSLCVALIAEGVALRLGIGSTLSETPLKVSRGASRLGRVQCAATAYETAERVQRCLSVKEKSGMSFDALATTLGLTNTYTCQLFLGQAQLKEATALKMKAALPDLADEDIEAMQRAPFRGFDDESSAKAFYEKERPLQEARERRA